MELYDYEKICKDVENGVQHTVINTETGEKGVVHMCNHGYFNVGIAGGEEVWPIDKCRDAEH